MECQPPQQVVHLHTPLNPQIPNIIMPTYLSVLDQTSSCSIICITGALSHVDSLTRIVRSLSHFSQMHWHYLMRHGQHNSCHTTVIHKTIANYVLTGKAIDSTTFIDLIHLHTVFVLLESNPHFWFKVHQVQQVLNILLLHTY